MYAYTYVYLKKAYFLLCNEKFECSEYLLLASDFLCRVES